MIKVNKYPEQKSINRYFDDLEEWENSFSCNECGCDNITDFTYDRTVANGEVWICKYCKTERLVKNKPNEDRY
jgi:DNA-directed RNA polymerase subunit RPC12/RpoP